MKRLVFVLSLALLLSLPRPLSSQQLSKDLGQMAHPRIMLFQEDEKAIAQMIQNNGQWQKLHQAILTESENIISLPPVERIQIGRRLLDKSREALRRIFQLSYAYRMTGEDKYLHRAEKELLAVSNFSDWNPSHFLDVSEMTLAVAIGYDWLYEHLSEDSKKTIREAIVKKGLEPSYNEKYNWFLKATHNWNQVCNAGMTFGAMAVYEDYPELAQETIERAVESMKLPMKDYQPDGAYPEGYGYWDYGTSFNVLFLDAVEKAYGSDFGLNDVPGFLETAGFYMNMTGATRQPYNWGDAGMGTNLTPAMFWFAQKNRDNSLLWVEKDYLVQEDYSRFTRNRLLPATLIWGMGMDLNIREPEEKFWTGQGANPVAMMRTSWSDPKAIYVGFKAGSPSVNHGHMDIGSFIMESDGIRWAMDFGMQSYETLESKGMQIFGRTQDAQRWTVMRLNNFVHNTLTINDQHQLVDGYARIGRHSEEEDFQFAISDISSVYKGQVKEALRGIGIVNQQYVVVQDEITALDKPATVRWNMLTPAEVKIKDDGTAVLEKDGEKLTLKVEGPKGIQLTTWSTEPTTDYDAPNPGTIRVGFDYELKSRESATLKVLLIPEGNDATTMPLKGKLTDWGD
jgi:hypothetical protein